MSSDMVASLDWVNNGENNYTMACPFPLEGESSNSGNVAMAVLTCRHNSHPFQKRTLYLNQAVKVGRSVAKTKADVNNAIFDCKVLSRHHASLWYENGHFYLADTKSSNGTFVNGHRLSEGNKESAPYEVCSGDIVQFGVDVMENSGSITHGCIIATLRLYLPDGKEAKVSSNLSMQPMPLDDLHILNKIIQEAIDREYLLEEKLNSLKQAVEGCRNAADASWRAQVCEDHLLCRVHFLEKRLAATNTNTSPTELQQLLEDKHKFEVSAKESLRLAHEEKLKLKNQVCNLQWSLCSTEDECAALRNNTERAHEEYQKLSIKYSTLEIQLKNAQKALENAEHRLAEEKSRLKDLIAEHDKQISLLKIENENHTVLECGMDELMDSEKSDLIINNKTWEKGDFKESSLPEAIRGLPDYIKAILPDQVLQKVGCKSLRSSSQVNELKLKLICLKNELCQLEKNRSADEANDNSAHATSKNETKTVDDNVSDNNSTIENHVVCSDIPLDDSKTKRLPNSESEEIDESFTEEKDAVNHKESSENSNFLEKPDKESETDMRSILLEEINQITEQLSHLKDDGPIEKMVFLQDELSNAHSKIASLRNEQITLESSLTLSHNKIVELKQDKEHLLSEKKILEGEITDKLEMCKSFELQIARLEKDKVDVASNSKYKELASELQNQLSKAFESESNSCKELKNLNDKIFELQKELDNRPQRADIEALESQIDKLQHELNAKEKYINDLKSQIATLSDMQVSLEDKLHTALSENNVISELCNSKKNVQDTVGNIQKDAISSDNQENDHLLISSSLSAENLIWNNDSLSSLSNISVDLKRLSELEEELVATKEKWAHVNEERSQLTTELQNITAKYNRLANRSIIDSLVYIVPLAAIFIYVIVMYQSVS